MNAKDISIEGLKLKVLIYGKSGTGKTTFACGFPRPYVFDMDGGMLSQRGKDVEYDTYSNYPTFAAKVAEFERACPYDTLIVDSITNLQEYMMKNLCVLNKRARPSQHEWGLLIFDLMELFMNMTKMNVNIVFTAHEYMLQNELTSEIMVLPLIYGKKLPGQLPLWFDEVYRAQVAQIAVGGKMTSEFQLLTVASTMYTAKTRLGLSAIEKPSYEEIMKKVRGGE